MDILQGLNVVGRLDSLLSLDGSMRNTIYFASGPVVKKEGFDMWVLLQRFAPGRTWKWIIEDFSYNASSIQLTVTVGTVESTLGTLLCL